MDQDEIDALLAAGWITDESGMWTPPPGWQAPAAAAAPAADPALAAYGSQFNTAALGSRGDPTNASEAEILQLWNRFVASANANPGGARAQWLATTRFGDSGIPQDSKIDTAVLRQLQESNLLDMQGSDQLSRFLSNRAASLETPGTFAETRRAQRLIRRQPGTGLTEYQGPRIGGPRVGPMRRGGLLRQPAAPAAKFRTTDQPQTAPSELGDFLRRRTARTPTLQGPRPYVR